MEKVMEPLVGIGALIVGVAIVAVLVSSRSQTPAVIQSLGSAFSNSLGVAVSPVSGSAPQLNLSYPSSPLGGSFGSFTAPQLGLGMQF